MLKNNKGITLMALLVTVVILFILSTVTIRGGFSTTKISRYYKGISELKAMQAKVNTLYEEYKNGDDGVKSDIEKYGEDIETRSDIEDIKSIFNDVYTKNVNQENIGNLEDYRYYSKEYIKNILGVDGIERDFIINIKTRSVITLEGIEKDSSSYFALCQIEGEQYNVQYEGK